MRRVTLLLLEYLLARPAAALSEPRDVGRVFELARRREIGAMNWRRRVPRDRDSKYPLAFAISGVSFPTKGIATVVECI